ncbi:MAG: hypothetical protein IKM17_09170, partial [Lentisphaeria bacterium]|nr:hypothetical protein [Lentisphaeria bacterium]
LIHIKIIARRPLRRDGLIKLIRHNSLPLCCFGCYLSAHNIHAQEVFYNIIMSKTEKNPTPCLYATQDLQGTGLSGADFFVSFSEIPP